MVLPPLLALYPIPLMCYVFYIVKCTLCQEKTENFLIFKNYAIIIKEGVNIMAHYSIGEFAKKTGLSISTLRYYEQEKLIYSHREENNRRYYDDSDIAWTQFIIRLKKTGMSIKNMQEYADLRYKGDSTIPQRLRLLFFQLDELHKQQTEINQHIDFLEKKIKTYLGINPN